MYSSIPWVALGISITVTTIVWLTIIDLDNQAQKLEFEATTEKISTRIQDQLKRHEQVLMGFKGLFSASKLVEPMEFTNFFEIQKIKERFPNYQGVGYIEHVNGTTERNELIDRFHEEGIDYTIYPEGDRPEYYPVVFLEPQDFRNKRAIGFDVYSEEIRRQAIDHAVKTGDTTLTGSLILVQETEENIQKGFLMLLPVYEYSNDNNGSEKFQGLVYSVFRMDDFIMGTLDEELFEYIQLKIYDNSIQTENIFFDSSNAESSMLEDTFSNSQTINFGGRQWILDFQGFVFNPSFSPINHINIPIVGYTMSFILFYAFVLFSKNVRLTKSMLKREKIATVGELSSRFAHDIRNPVSNIKMAVELLREREISDDYTRDKFDIISKNLERISHQVDDVLDYIRSHPIEKTKGSFNSCLNESIENLTIPKNIKINYPTNELHGLADFFQIQIVFKNLISNAIQAIQDQKGTITIRFSENPESSIIEIEDTGCGFQGVDTSKIFEPLITTKSSGTGLGLVSCKKIIENHDGTISVKANPTVFTITLPKK